MNKRAVFVLSLVMLVFISSAVSGPIDITLKENYVEGANGTNSSVYNNWYVGEYVVQIGSPSAYADIYAGFCVDPANSTPTYQDYNLAALPSASGDLSTRVQEAAWVFYNYGSAFNPSVSGQTKVDAQTAIWNLVFPYFSISLPDISGTTAATMVSAAQTAVAGGWQAPADIQIAYSPGASDPLSAINHGFQDYLIKVPEPGLILLLGIGLFVAVLAPKAFKN